MPSHAQSSTSIDDRYAATQLAALNHIKSTQSRRRSKKHSHDPKRHTSSPHFNDFVLFPNSNENARESTRQQSPKHERRRSDEKLEEKATHLAAASDRSAKTDSPRRARTPRHGGFKIVNILDESDDGRAGRRRDGKSTPPPAPEPPTLDSPDLSDADDEAFWGASGGREGSEGDDKDK